MEHPVTAGSCRFYPFSDRTDLNIDPTYGELRSKEPVARVRMPYGGDAWLVTRHADAKKALSDPRLSIAAGAGRDVPRASPRLQEPDGLMGLPPDAHARLRRLVATAFTPKRVRDIAPRVVQLADKLLDDVVETGPPADLVQQLALPLPVMIICEMMGIGYDEQHLFRAFSDALMSSTRYTADQVDRAVEDFVEYLGGLLAQRRAHRTDDLLGALVEARDDGDRLTEGELVMLTGGLLVGGHETTASQIASQIFLLLRDRTRYEQLHARPELIPTAVEELLRVAPLWASVGPTRIATEDLELNGTTIRAGDAVVFSLASANQDDDVFANAADVVLDRDPNPHIAFGHGPHYCIGASLARLEIQAAIGALARRLPGLRLAVEENELEWNKGMMVRSLVSLPVTW
ncbi:cytochrome P450 [Micromonospora carbonacea]|uniref:Cytochrome P450 n=1 Tax=Micromonospora carbonacea TaxID=47853 RepID=A0A1C5AZ10_9ACTN|nr:cytochrome P450 [Micromonospora carbonacea]SCF50459.1 Cytochrome P450 [Micromonospora carbonacea]